MYIYIYIICKSNTNTQALCVRHTWMPTTSNCLCTGQLRSTTVSPPPSFTPTKCNFRMLLAVIFARLHGIRSARRHQRGGQQHGCPLYERQQHQHCLLHSRVFQRIILHLFFHLLLLAFMY